MLVKKTLLLSTIEIPAHVNAPMNVAATNNYTTGLIILLVAANATSKFLPLAMPQLATGVT